MTTSTKALLLALSLMASVSAVIVTAVVLAKPVSREADYWHTVRSAQDDATDFILSQNRTLPYSLRCYLRASGSIDCFVPSCAEPENEHRYTCRPRLPSEARVDGRRCRRQ